MDRKRLVINMSSSVATTKKPRKIKVNSVVNQLGDDTSNLPVDEPQQTVFAPKRYTITKDKVVGMTMEDRHKKTEEDIKHIDLSCYAPEELPKIHEFIASLTLDEKKAMLIAIDHLGSSFDIVKCIHYQSWVKSAK
jgi:hypothetical protein